MDIKALLEAIPIPYDADMPHRRKFARRYSLVFLRRGSPTSDDKTREESLQRTHMHHLTKLQLLGKLVLNGPTLDAGDLLGVSVYAAEIDEARALAEADPKVKAGYIAVEAMPWIAVPHDVPPQA